ncbi:ABC transporter permease [Gordonia liuliyuniae]|uniref:ABC transporter permease n=1 Tax=Gordonia liuliyuniae TaxID=2911517 RepID=A0ABS9INU1_9ACTN|nr:ABC transporter permease [Gordonia liuliyuniae]MCF8587210.1 ABC transporter permease [Gordonia liuliyuniae]
MIDLVGDRLLTPRKGRIRFGKHPMPPLGAVAAVGVLVTVLAAAVVPGLLTRTDPVAVAPRERLRAPSVSHVFGTDQLGRDVFARIVHGTGASLSAALIAVAIAIIGGSLIGVATGYLGGWTDRVGMRLVDVLLAVPGLLLSMTVVAATGGGTVELGVAVGIAGVAGAARVVRSRTLQLRASPFVEAALVSGWRKPTVVARHVLPHLWPTAAAVASVEFGQAVLAVAALGFLGFGPPPPAPEWGAMVADGRAFLAASWWLTVVPAVVITLVVLAAYRLSRIVDGGHRA